MPTYTGTNGNDNLPPSGGNNSGNDVFTPLLGIDTVDGGNGDDLLIIDYSSNTYTGNATYVAGISTNIYESVPGTFTGNYLAYNSGTGTYDQVNFNNIERFQITGTNFGDTISTGWNNDVINAGAGNDIIDGRGGIDTINGGAGTDTVIYLDASDETNNLVINNSGGMIGLSNGTVVTNVEQFQSVDAGSGNDTIAFTDSLNHAIDGGGGNDAITTGGGNDTITGGDGNDTINAGLGINSVYGGTGNDLLVLDYSSNTFAGNVTYPAGITLSYYGGNGSTGWSGNYFAYKNGSGGYDQVSFQDIERFQVTGTAYNDSFDQSGYGSIIDGGAGIDTLNNADFGLETGNLSLNNSGATYTRSDGSTIRNVERFGNVTLGSGNDTIVFTDALNHSLVGGDGNDSIAVGGGNDTLNGGDGNDTLNAGFGNNQALGGTGNDLLVLDYSGNTYAGTVNYPAGIQSNPYSGDSVNGWTGYYSAYNNASGASAQVYFQDIERFQITGTAYNDAFGQVAAGSSIDGGLGTDTITNADFSNETGNLTLNNSGAALTLSDGSVIRSVERFGNLTTGSGNDTISFTDNLSHQINAGAGNNAITTGSGDDNIVTDLGNDTINAGLGNNNVDGGAGNDLLIIDYSGNTLGTNSGYPAGISSSISNNGLTGWSGYYYAYNTVTFDQVYFNNIELLQITGTAYGDTFDQWGYGFTINGGAGTDTIVNANFGKETANLTVNNSGGAIALGDGSVISNVEQFQNLTTGSGNDTIFFNDTLGHYILGGAGNDVITTGAGNDGINGGAGNDTLNAGLGYNNADGGSGNDLLILDYSGNTFPGNASFPGGITSSLSGNSVTGWSGSFLAYNNAAGTYDLVSFSAVERFQLVGTAANDSFQRGGYGFTINGGAGTDTIVFADFSRETTHLTLNNSGATITLIDGTTIANVERFQNLTTGSGNDTISFTDNLDRTLNSGLGNDAITTGAGNDTINGGAGNDTINPGRGINSVDAGTANDLLIFDYSGNTFAGNTSYPAGITSSIGGNSIVGWNGSFTAYNNASGTYDQVNFSGVERFQITGTVANDSFFQGSYGFTIDGGAGTDTIVNADFSRETVNLTLNNTGGPITLSDGTVIRNVEQFQNLTTGTGNDTVNLTDNLNKVINTGTGNDWITTGAGNDTINSGIGNDTINAGLGNNSVDGGKGNDLLILDYSSNTYAGNATYAAGITGSLSYIGQGAWNGSFSAFKNTSGASDSVSFSNIEQFQITGTGFNDSIRGGSNNDTIRGGAGRDTLDGGGGIDTLSYAGSTAGVNVNLTTNTAGGGDATGDVISNFENLIGSANNDTLVGNADGNIIIGGGGADLIDGGAGIDTLSFATATAAVNVNLATGAVTGGNTTTGSSFTNFENLIGSSLNDTLIGSAGDNVINGGAGADSIDGGAGIDTVSYDGSSAGVNANLATGTGTGGDAAGDIIANVENLTGSSFDDTLGGNGGNNAIVGNAGNDSLNGGAGADTIDGGAGIDTLSYLGSTAGVNVNLATGATSGGDAVGDVILNVENLTGSALNDTLTGNAGNNVINGGVGADSLDGGAGIDTLSYNTSTAGVNVNLATGAAAGGDATGDTIINFENISGSEFDDNLTGNTGNNVISGRGGNDLINGGAGADTIDGGAGIDTLSYLGSTTGVSVSLASGAGTAGDAAGEVIAGVENLTGSALNDTLIGSADNNTIVGGVGADSLDGGAGIDTLSYLGSTVGVNVNLATNTATGGDATGDTIANFENLTGSALNDTLTGGNDNNAIIGGAGADSLGGGGGVDTLSYLGSAAGVNVNLLTNTATGGDAAGDIISGFENLTGSGFNDTLIGGADNNTISGGVGADSLDGGAGVDTLSYLGSTVGVNVSLLANTATGGDAAGDVISNFENLIGSALNDTLIGSAANNLINGGAGADSLDGGAGVDTLSYETSTGGVSVNLATNGATGGDAAGDVIANFENVNGSGLNDTLTGNGVSNALAGGAGNDLINGGAGADSLDGGAGVDTLSYLGSTVGVNVNLAANTATGGDATGDVIVSFENLTGSALNDTLIGSTANNTISGGAGKDSLTGGGGSDRFGYNSLTDSLLANFDVITDFNGADDFFLVGTARTSFNNVGAVATLDATGIGAKLTSAAFGSNGAAQFTFGSRTFVAINDATAGFSSSTDAIVELTGLTGSLGLGNFVIV